VYPRRYKIQRHISSVLCIALQNCIALHRLISNTYSLIWWVYFGPHDRTVIVGWNTMRLSSFRFKLVRGLGSRLRLLSVPHAALRAAYVEREMRLNMFGGMKRQSRGVELSLGDVCTRFASIITWHVLATRSNNCYWWTVASRCDDNPRMSSCARRSCTVFSAVRQTATKSNQIHLPTQHTVSKSI